MAPTRTKPVSQPGASRSVRSRATPAKSLPKDEIAAIHAARSLLKTGRKSSATPVELKEIVARISEWAAGPRQALAWCREVGIPALGGFTAAELVASGEGRSVLTYLDHIAVGGFA
jgi:hypothetical protein